jgi:hypothetical protein
MERGASGKWQANFRYDSDAGSHGWVQYQDERVKSTGQAQGKQGNRPHTMMAGASTLGDKCFEPSGEENSCYTFGRNSQPSVQITSNVALKSLSVFMPYIFLK